MIFGKKSAEKEGFPFSAFFHHYSHFPKILLQIILFIRNKKKLRKVY